MQRQPAIVVIDEIFHHHGDRCLDATRWHLAETLDHEMMATQAALAALEQERRRCRDWVWLWLATLALLVAAVAALMLDIRL